MYDLDIFSQGTKEFFERNPIVLGILLVIVLGALYLAKSYF